MRLLIGLIGVLCMAQERPAFIGNWVYQVEGQAVMELRLTPKLTGSLVKPKAISIGGEGEIESLSGGPETLSVQKAKVRDGKLELRIDGDDFVMTMTSADVATLRMGEMKPWPLVRVPEGTAVLIATTLPHRNFPAEIEALRAQLTAMVKEDQDARLAFDEARITAADDKDRPQVLRIFEQYGWVTKLLAGADAAHNYWLLVQHQTPEIQQKLLPSLEKAAKAGDASMSDYAYLYDRVQTGLGKPQHWGTQTKCEGGKPVLFPVDDMAGLEARRAALFLQTMREYLKVDYLRKACAQK